MACARHEIPQRVLSLGWWKLICNGWVFIDHQQNTLARSWGYDQYHGLDRRFCNSFPQNSFKFGEIGDALLTTLFSIQPSLSSLKVYECPASAAIVDLAESHSRSLCLSPSDIS